MQYAEEMGCEHELCLHENPRKVGILGGTFNPIHNGHIQLARQVLIEQMLDEIWFMPCASPPHKSAQPTDAAARFHMACLAVRGENAFCVSDMELRRKGRTYTVDTVNELLKKFPKAEFQFIIGADTLFELCTWKRCEEVLKKIGFICVMRSGRQYLECAKEAQTLMNAYGAKIVLSGVMGLNISSSLIRGMVKAGDSIAGLVCPEVEDFILENGLYK